MLRKLESIANFNNNSTLQELPRFQFYNIWKDFNFGSLGFLKYSLFKFIETKSNIKFLGKVARMLHQKLWTGVQYLSKGSMSKLSKMVQITGRKNVSLLVSLLPTRMTLSGQLDTLIGWSNTSNSGRSQKSTLTPRIENFSSPDLVQFF